MQTKNLNGHEEELERFCPDFTRSVSPGMLSQVGKISLEKKECGNSVVK